MFYKKGVLRNFAKLIEKRLCQNLFIKVLKKKLWHRCFPVNFAKFLKNPFSYRTLLVGVSEQKSHRLTILKSKNDWQKWTSKRKKHDEETQNKTPLVLTYNGFLPNISNIVWKYWNILNISRRLRGLFQEESIRAFKKNSNLK